MILPQIDDFEKNKTETMQLRPGRSRPPSRAKRGGHCVFVLESDGNRAFCAAPTLADSAYCRHHHRLCAVDPCSAAGREAIRNIEHDAQEAAPVPIELAYLSCVAAPELDSADDPRDIAACLDLSLPNDRIDE